jgi:hypothetical protein
MNQSSPVLPPSGLTEMLLLFEQPMRHVPGCQHFLSTRRFRSDNQLGRPGTIGGLGFSG